MKLLLKLFLSLIIIVFVAGGIFLWTFDLNRYRETITLQLSQALGRPVTIENMEMKLSLIPTIRASRITIGNPSAFNSSEPLLNAEAVDLTIALPPLFNKEIQVRDIQIINVTVNFIQTAEGNNLVVTATDTPVQSGKTNASANSATANNPYLSQLSVDTIKANQVIINYLNQEQKEQIKLTDITIRQLKAISGTITYRAIPIQLSANFDLLQLIQMGNNFIFNIQLNALGTKTKVSGNIADMKKLQNILLNLDIEADNLAKTAAQFNIVLPSQITKATLSGILKGGMDRINIQSFALKLDNLFNLDLKGSIEGLPTNPLATLTATLAVQNGPVIAQTGIKPMNITLKTKVQKDSADISQLTINANRSDINAAFKANWNTARVNLSGIINSNFLNPNDLYQAVAQNNTQPKAPVAQPKGSPETNADTDHFINKINARIDWNLKNIELAENSGEYYGITAKTVLNNGIFTGNPIQIKTIAGIINAALRVQGLADSTPKTQLTFAGENIDLDKIKTLRAYLSGSTANLNGNITTRGIDTQTALSHLTGNIEVEITQGKVVNQEFNDLPHEIGLTEKNKSFSYSKTDSESVLNCAAFNLKMNNGLINLNKNVAVETSVLDVVLSGIINLPAQTLSLSLEPSLPNGAYNRLINAAQLIKIEGSFSNPKMRLDTQKIISKGIEKGVEKGLNKLLDKAGLTGKNTNTNTKDNGATTNTTTAKRPLSLCEAALGHKLKGKQNKDMPIIQRSQNVNTSRDTTSTKIQKEELTPQETLKMQLIKSLSSAVQ